MRGEAVQERFSGTVHTGNAPLGFTMNGPTHRAGGRSVQTLSGPSENREVLLCPPGKPLASDC